LGCLCPNPFPTGGDRRPSIHVRLRFGAALEKDGKAHTMPCHHNLETYLTAYVGRAGLAEDPKGPLFRTIHHARDTFSDGPALARTLGRQRLKDTSLDYEAARDSEEPMRRYARRRGLDPLRPVSEIVAPSHQVQRPRASAAPEQARRVQAEGWPHRV
jgi:hypothetical protein